MSSESQRRPWRKNVLVLALYGVLVFGMMITPQFFGFDVPESVMTIGGALIGGLITLCMTLLKSEESPHTD